MVLVQKWSFLQPFFKGNIGQENVFYDILERKNAFLAYKNNKFKESKNSHFSMVLVQKWPTFFYNQHRPGKCLYQYSKTEKRLSRL